MAYNTRVGYHQTQPGKGGPKPVPAIQFPNFLLVGGTGRNSGKTEFVCSIIRTAKASHPVVGLKVTTFTEGDEGCHGQRDAHTAARYYPTGYQITEEKQPVPDKDTSRMLQAGAGRVYWLRARRECLTEGLDDVLRMVEPGELVVCESNSLRHILKPDIFLVIRDQMPEIKPTCLEVLGMADVIVTSDGKSFIPPPDAVVYSGGRWTINRNFNPQ
jgi:molybdopterin-guanine dinucleotide biosynthesis protein